MDINDYSERIAEVETDFAGDGISVRCYELRGSIWAKVAIENGAHPMDCELNDDPDAWDGEIEAAIEQLQHERDS